MIICGVDEAGRGPLAGPVVAGAVILSDNCSIVGLKDSKRMTAKARDRCAAIIKQDALAWGIGVASVCEIAQLNILQATKLAMLRAVEQLTIVPDLVRVDGKDIIEVSMNCEAVIKGDSLYLDIAAASVLAKVTRDNYMIELAEKYPGYGFEKHKGYGTKLHIKAIQSLGITEQHRVKFAPIAEMLK